MTPTHSTSKAGDRLANWQPRERPGQWPLVGTRISLEPLNWDAHGDGLFASIAGAGNAAIWDYMPIGPFTDLAAFRRTFEHVCDRFGWETLVFKRTRDHQIVGMASYMRIREEHGSAEVGCVAFSDALKRTAEASEAMYLMAAHVFDELGYRRYEWKCHNENKASKRAALRFGFAFEGIFRNDMVLDGENRDTAWYAMTDTDWPSVKAGYEAWLSPNNFDSDGWQKQKLATTQKRIA